MKPCPALTTSIREIAEKGTREAVAARLTQAYVARVSDDLEPGVIGAQPTRPLLALSPNTPLSVRYIPLIARAGALERSSA
jgi:hypothetical protein